MPHSKPTSKSIWPWHWHKSGNRKNENPPSVHSDFLSRRLNHIEEDAPTPSVHSESDSFRGNENPPSVLSHSDSSGINEDMLSAHYDFDSSSDFLSVSSKSVVDEDSDTEVVEPLKHDDAVPVSDVDSNTALSAPIRPR
jgi:hypothetical protein